MSTLEIIGAPLSNFVRVVRMACHEKGVEYTLTPVRPHTPEVDAISPVGKIPVVRHGDFALAESRAICGYIDTAFPGPALMPRDAKTAAICEQWISLVCTTIDIALLRNYVLYYVFPATPGQLDHEKIAAAQPKCRQAFEMLEKRLTASPYLAGAEFTLADVFLYPIIAIMPAFPESAALLEASPSRRAWAARVAARDSAKATEPPPRN